VATVKPGADTKPRPTAKAAADGRAPADGKAPPDGKSPPVVSDESELLDRLRAAWPEVVAHVARNPANRPLITACRPVEIRDGMVVLGFPEGQAFLRDIAERKRAVLEEGLTVVLGRPVGVRCVATNVSMADARAPETADDDLVLQARRVFEGDLADVAEVE